MKDKFLSQLIDKYLKGTCSPEEEILLLDWYNSVENTDDPILSLTEEQKQSLKNRMFARIFNNADLAKHKEIKPKLHARIYYYAAASIAAAFLIVYSFLPQSKSVLLTAQSQVNKETSSKLSFTNTSKKISKHQLPDNSIVWLKPHASISYDKKFINKYRLVSLSGEAFFEIEKDSKHPFLIYSGEVITRVVGTSFNIKANTASAATEVSVISGKVFVYSPSAKTQKHKSVYLEREQKVTFVKADRKLIKRTGNESSLGIWTRGNLSFDNAPIAEVVNSLNEQFGAKIILADTRILHYTLKADFSEVNLPAILELLSKSLNITYELQGENIMISAKPETNQSLNLNRIE